MADTAAKGREDVDVNVEEISEIAEIETGRVVLVGDDTYLLSV